MRALLPLTRQVLENFERLEALSHLAARVLAQDTAGMLAELEENSVEEKLKAKVTEDNA